MAFQAVAEPYYLSRKIKTVTQSNLLPYLLKYFCFTFKYGNKVG